MLKKIGAMIQYDEVMQSSSVCNPGKLTCHCVFGSQEQCENATLQLIGKKKEVDFWCFFLFPKACLVDFELHFLYVLCTFPACDNVQLASRFYCFHVIFLPGFVRHTHIHTMQTPWVKVFTLFSFCRAFMCRVVCILCARFEY